MSGDFATPGASALLSGIALPATLYMQLHTGDPGTNGTANVAAVGVRKSLGYTAPSGTGPIGVTNSAQVQWTNVPASETITHVSLWSAITAGTCWFIDDCPDTSIFTGDSVTLLTGSLSISFPVW